VAVVGKLVQIYKININVCREKQYTTKQKYRTHITQQNIKKQEDKHKRINLKKLIRTKQRTKCLSINCISLNKIK
jgi:hypothetical protein